MDNVYCFPILVVFTLLCDNENEACTLKIALLIEMGYVCLEHVTVFLHGDSDGGWHSAWIRLCYSLILFPGELKSACSTCMCFAGGLLP